MQWAKTTTSDIYNDSSIWPTTLHTVFTKFLNLTAYTRLMPTASRSWILFNLILLAKLLLLHLYSWTVEHLWIMNGWFMISTELFQDIRRFLSLFVTLDLFSQSREGGLTHWLFYADFTSQTLTSPDADKMLRMPVWLSEVSKLRDEPPKSHYAGLPTYWRVPRCRVYTLVHLLYPSAGGLHSSVDSYG